ncbi:MAG: CBS domain-containing protein [Fimbriimonas sp.]
MNVSEIMTRDVTCCGRDTTLREAARMMVEHDCGSLPVAENRDGSGRIVGMITDRDMAVRCIAHGMDPNTTQVGQCMSADPVCARPEMSLEECERMMSQHQVRRIPVCGADGSCVGMVAQADLALSAPGQEVAMVLRDLSKPAMA